MQKQRKSDVPPTLSVFLENKLCYIFKKTLFHFSSRFDIWHHGIVNLQQAEELLTGIVRKPMLCWTPWVFITPGTYHINLFPFLWVFITPGTYHINLFPFL